MPGHVLRPYADLPGLEQWAAAAGIAGVLNTRTPLQWGITGNDRHLAVHVGSGAVAVCRARVDRLHTATYAQAAASGDRLCRSCLDARSERVQPATAYWEMTERAAVLRLLLQRASTPPDGNDTADRALAAWVESLLFRRVGVNNELLAVARSAIAELRTTRPAPTTGTLFVVHLSHVDNISRLPLDAPAVLVAGASTSLDHVMFGCVDDFDHAAARSVAGGLQLSGVRLADFGIRNPDPDTVVLAQRLCNDAVTPSPLTDAHRAYDAALAVHGISVPR